MERKKREEGKVPNVKKNPVEKFSAKENLLILLLKTKDGLRILVEKQCVTAGGYYKTIWLSAKLTVHVIMGELLQRILFELQC